MEDIKSIIEKYRNVSIGTTISINDLKEKEADGDLLKDEERLAVFNYDHYVRGQLDKDLSEEDFHDALKALQVMANLKPYRDFLDEKYSHKI